MVAAVCTWHERHAAVAVAIEQRLGRGDRLVTAAHAVVETYAVLTRLPPPHRVSSSDAWTLVRTNFVKPAKVIALPAAGHMTLLEKLANDGVGGGRTYDALIAATFARTLPMHLLTLNPRHFESREGLTVVEPGRASA